MLTRCIGVACLALLAACAGGPANVVQGPGGPRSPIGDEELANRWQGVYVGSLGVRATGQASTQGTGTMVIEAAQGHLQVVCRAEGGPEVAFHIAFYTLRAETELTGTYRPDAGGRVDYTLRRQGEEISGEVKQYAQVAGTGPTLALQLTDFRPLPEEPPAAGPQWSWPEPQRFAQAIAAFEAADRLSPPPMCAIVGVGSSSMRGWHRTIAADLSPLNIIPRGFGGSNMNDVLYYVDRVVLAYKPRAVLLYEGDNDVAAGVPPQEILATFQALVQRIHTASWQTQIYVLAVKPSIARWEMWPLMKETNRLLKKACAADPRFTYIDVATPMLGKDGRPKADIFVDDNLHMNAKGYALWTAAVRPVLIDKEAFWEP